MADVFSRKKRSAIMAAVRSKNTKPEKALKRLLRTKHIRYRSHYTRLPGTPDIMLLEHKIVIFVNGCFWHGHQGCMRGKMPTTNTSFWKAKITKNKLRDARSSDKLRRMEWKVRTFWTCMKPGPYVERLERQLPRKQSSGVLNPVSPRLAHHRAV